MDGFTQGFDYDALKFAEPASGGKPCVPVACPPWEEATMTAVPVESWEYFHVQGTPSGLFLSCGIVETCTWQLPVGESYASLGGLREIAGRHVDWHQEQHA